MYFDDSPYAGQLEFDLHEVMIMPETKAISSAIATFLFIAMKFDLQNNGFFSEKLPSLHNFLKNTGLRQAQAPQPYTKLRSLSLSKGRPLK